MLYLNYLIFFIIIIIIGFGIDPVEDKLIKKYIYIKQKIKKEIKKSKKRKGRFKRRGAQLKYNSSSLKDIKKTTKYKKFIKKHKKDPNKIIKLKWWIWFTAHLYNFVF